MQISFKMNQSERAAGEGARRASGVSARRARAGGRCGQLQSRRRPPWLGQQGRPYSPAGRRPPSKDFQGGTSMSERGVEALRLEREEVLRVARSLSEDEWARPSD